MSTTADQHWFTLTFSTEATKGVWHSADVTSVFGLPVQNTESALQRAAADAGIVLDELLDEASAHFTGGPDPFTRTLTQSELEALAEDDDECL